MNKKLQRQIASQLEKLSRLLDNIQEAQIIVAQEPETWDSGTLYNLTTELKAALQLLEDQKSSQEKDPWGDPLVLEEGLGSLMNAYLENSEAEEDD
jgi:predicted HNH restriction endonuclease